MSKPQIGIVLYVIAVSMVFSTTVDFLLIVPPILFSFWLVDTREKDLAVVVLQNHGVSDRIVDQVVAELIDDKEYAEITVATVNATKLEAILDECENTADEE